MGNHCQSMICNRLPSLGRDLLGTQRKWPACGSHATQQKLDFLFLFHKLSPYNKENVIGISWKYLWRY